MVTLAKQMHADGLSYRKIAAELALRGHLTGGGKPHTASAFKKCLASDCAIRCRHWCASRRVSDGAVGLSNDRRSPGSMTTISPSLAPKRPRLWKRSKPDGKAACGVSYFKA
jgi:hypothetical protein